MILKLQRFSLVRFQKKSHTQKHLLMAFFVSRRRSLNNDNNNNNKTNIFMYSCFQNDFCHPKHCRQ